MILSCRLFHTTDIVFLNMYKYVQRFGCHINVLRVLLFLLVYFEQFFVHMAVISKLCKGYYGENNQGGNT